MEELRLCAETKENYKDDGIKDGRQEHICMYGTQTMCWLSSRVCV